MSFVGWYLQKSTYTYQTWSVYVQPYVAQTRRWTQIALTLAWLSATNSRSRAPQSPFYFFLCLFLSF